jgi:hypothetical protein
MRSFSIVIMLLVLGFKLSAQNNLQFNQVKLVGSTAETVPAGKVWKIESAPISVKDGIQAIPRFLMGPDTIVLSCCDPYISSDLENVTSVRLEWEGSNQFNWSGNGAPGTNFLSNGASNIVVNIIGTKKPGQSFQQVLNFSNISNISQTNGKVSLGTASVQNSGINQISSFDLSFDVLGKFINNGGYPIGYYYYGNYAFYFTFYLANGSIKTYSINYETTLGNYWNYYDSSVSIFPKYLAGPTIGSVTKQRDIDTQFPIWIPAGTAVKTLSNIGKLSILEFNVTQ